MSLHGQVFTWGFCTHGQLGLKEKILGAREYVEVPTHAGPGSVLSEIEVKAADCGHFHTIVADTKGNLYSFGRNDRGQLGRGDDIDDPKERPGAVPRRIKTLSTSIVCEVSCGAFHCLAATADGSLFSWGWNQSGQLGRKTAYRTDAEPGLVSLESGSLRSFAAGLSHSAAVLSSGQVFTWGGNDHGQLGVGRTVRHPDVADTPIFVNGVLGRNLAAGDNHTVVVSLDSLVFATGDNTYMQLGKDKADINSDDFGRFLEVAGLPHPDDGSGDSISSAACGGCTCAVISMRGHVYAWGGGVWGQLGQGDRRDSCVPVKIQGLPRVIRLAIAQDHILAQGLENQVQAASTSSPPKAEAAQLGEEDEEDDTATSTLWAWGRRKLLPKGIGRDGGISADSEAQCTPAEVPLRCFGMEALPVGQVRVQAACGGAHSIVHLGIVEKKNQHRKFTAERCATTSIVTGPGTKGGRVSESIQFTIISRNEDGRDEKVGGLRFRVWAEYGVTSNPKSPTRRQSSESLPASNANSPSSSTRRQTDRGLSRQVTGPVSAHAVFDLQYLNDCKDGTYAGAYKFSKTGNYRLHVHLLPAGLPNDADTSSVFGEPLKGSPLLVAVDSGPACAGNCQMRLKRGGRMKKMGHGNGQSGDKEAEIFEVEACADVAWDVLSFDVLGNAGTLQTDRFTAIVESAEPVEDLAQKAPESAQQDLASSMGFAAVPPSSSPASQALRERIRQRNAERVWLQVAGRSTASSSSSSSSSSTPLLVRQGKDPGRAEIRWTPGSIGNYKLHVALLGPPGPDSKVTTAVKGSPFHVQVVAGRPVASQSKLLVGAAADTRHLVPTGLAVDSLAAELPIRLLLRDRAGNVCTESTDPLRHVSLRVDAVAVVGDTSDDPPENLLQWSVAKTGASTMLISVTGSQELIDVARECRRDRETCAVVQFFVSAAVMTTHERLQGSPWPVTLDIPPECLENEVPNPSCAEAAETRDEPASPKPLGILGEVDQQQQPDPLGADSFSMHAQQQKQQQPESAMQATAEKTSMVQAQTPARAQPLSLAREILKGTFAASAAALPRPIDMDMGEEEGAARAFTKIEALLQSNRLERLECARSAPREAPLQADSEFGALEIAHSNIPAPQAPATVLVPEPFSEPGFVQMQEPEEQPQQLRSQDHEELSTAKPLLGLSQGPAKQPPCTEKAPSGKAEETALSAIEIAAEANAPASVPIRSVDVFSGVECVDQECETEGSRLEEQAASTMECDDILGSTLPELSLPAQVRPLGSTLPSQQASTPRTVQDQFDYQDSLAVSFLQPSVLASPKVAPKRRSLLAVSSNSSTLGAPTRRRLPPVGGGGLIRMKEENQLAAPSPWPKVMAR